MKPRSPLRLRLLQGALVVVLVGVVVARPGVPVAAQPVGAGAATPLPAELRYVPADAALFLYADASGLWTGPLAQSLRTANKVLFNRAEDAAKPFGVKPEDLKSVAVFVPKLKGSGDEGQLGIVLRFQKAFDKEKLTAGVRGASPQGAKVQVLAPSDTLAVVLVGLGDAYAKPQAVDADGPLTGALRAAGSGRHVLVAGATLANLPDELQRDNLPAEVRAFQPLFQSQAVTATVTLGKALEVSVRARAKREGLTADAEKALGALATLITEQLDRELPDLEKDAAGDAGLKDLVTVYKAALGAVKGAKFASEGADAHLTASLPLGNLPLVSAYQSAATRLNRVRGAAAAARSTNNLKQIGIAMHNYADTNGSMPPAAVCDKKGKPQLSWRVLILPYLEQGALYKEFKLDEPWDSAHNKKLLAKMPITYALPGAEPGTTETHYRVFVGNDAGFDWVVGAKFPAAFPDGTSNTIMCVTAATAVPWTKPDELEFDPEKDMGKLIGCEPGGRALVAMFDGSVRAFKKLPSKATLNGAITKSGGEVLGADF
ncbi:DUF1559 family PulG-like putative transporter [Frigoriglobus tundricola]|uniref:DUF1559 domain-containing protein n=1 Tax=Frigoriglobus tundricola TaxID=2774151 RepID=A0A6M5YFA4_9BACT|nr:DUF1559 domain-containing protein [Frigoriglobus tundricola]QJW92695.1 hypothetical protein FTUN_0192 [Frigoriglobus tundricola]